MKKWLAILLMFVTLWFVSCEKDLPYNPTEPITNPSSPSLDELLDSVLQFNSDGVGRAYFTLPSSNAYNDIPQDPLNPITSAKVALGKLLFHEPGIATDPFEPEGLHTYSCASCHHAKAGFQSGTFQGIGEGGLGFGVSGEARFRNKLYTQDFAIDVQPIRTPSVLNVAYQEAMLYGGRMGGTGINEPYANLWQSTTAPEHFNTFGLEGVETQAIGGLQIHRMEIDTEFVLHNEYKAMFDNVFGNVNEIDRYQKYTAGLAIAAYQRTLLPNQAPFQLWLRGNSNAMSSKEKEGAMLFFGKANCATCHTGPAFNSMEFHALGMNDLNQLNIISSDPPSGANMNRGRGDFTQNEEELFQFKVPQLYNLIDAPFYGHGASFHTVKDVVKYKNDAVSENPNVPISNLSSAFQPLNLTEEEIDLIVLFIEQSLRDPNLNRYVPDELPSGFCFPNNDTYSRDDLGCQ